MCERAQSWVREFYFDVGKFYYFGAPILIGWGTGLIAARQRLKAVWPTVGLVLIALIGGTAQVHASRPAVPGGVGHISMDFFPWLPSGHFRGLLYALVIFAHGAAVSHLAITKGSLSFRLVACHRISFRRLNELIKLTKK